MHKCDTQLLSSSTDVEPLAIAGVGFAVEINSMTVGNYVSVLVTESATPKGRANPVAGASVRLIGPGGPFVKTTGSDGKVLFERLPEPNVKKGYVIEVSYKGETQTKSGRHVSFLFVTGTVTEQQPAITITITNRVVAEYEARSYPHDDRNGNGLLELYRVPVYEVFVSGFFNGKEVVFRHIAPRFMPYWNNPRKPHPHYTHRGWLNAGLSAGQRIVVSQYKKSYRVQNRFSPYFGAIVLRGTFYIHGGPATLSDAGMGSAGCVEIIGNFDEFKAQIAVLSGIKEKSMDARIEDLVSQKRLIVVIEPATVPNIERAFSREVPDPRRRHN